MIVLLSAQTKEKTASPPRLARIAPGLSRNPRPSGPLKSGAGEPGSGWRTALGGTGPLAEDLRCHRHGGHALALVIADLDRHLALAALG